MRRLVSPDNCSKRKTKGWKLSILADLNDLGIYTSASDLSAKRDFLKNQRQRARAFMMAYCEAIWLGKNNKSVALASFRNRCGRTIRAASKCCTEIMLLTLCR